MILMGLPGSYIIATPNSYVGSLVELAGGENVYSDTDQEFLTVNTEDMKTKELDIILRAAHALPDQVVEMFNKDFAENDIWQHFDAVKNGRVYDLTYEYFGMSATRLNIHRHWKSYSRSCTRRVMKIHRKQKKLK